ncbi:probable LRR receptor-like serine/threonine-protein kinase RKF3 [Cajanus cajan]|uniref:non-specific serine/threonine protein kinase n=1 Tax=Cajanus cajan TaxID=3821 RepID=A0A151TWT4_CAJCA|nr:probable LRR receptor-like serine/threonine-protein kinase RKF3 [Cajanus cajan]KYP71527.1 putative LRR receptor-like serine/threonine-protein kinase RKF3 [Cajanus cajan]
MNLFLFLFLFPSLSLSLSATCPLNFTILGTEKPSSFDSSKCPVIKQAFRLVQSDYLRRTDLFLPPQNASEACWQSFQSYVNLFDPTYDIRSSCGFQTSSISQGCANVTTRQQFESLVPQSTLQKTRTQCNQSLENNSPCAICLTSLSSFPSFGQSLANLTDCTAYASIYAAAFANRFGPDDPGTAKCLFSLDFPSHHSSNKKKILFPLLSLFSLLAFSLLLLAFWACCKSRRKTDSDNKDLRVAEMGLVSGLDSMDQSTTLIKFTFEDVKKATKNFSRDNIIGRGGYGNVYKGLLPDGSEVAFKRFKNCSASGDASFTHEVQVIASIRHVNLVALRGYCSVTTRLEGYQRIIVCDLVKNGSLHDHLFGSNGVRLSWPIRQSIALGTARGLAYLHYGAQPSIIHRDIKASNILLDDKFEAKVADFGLAKFNPEGMTHMSTRVAGTMGYVAPEYALYGQLTERSDVFSFGVVLLELLSGRKALQMNNDGQPSALTDWAWSLVRTGKALDVVEDGMPQPASPQVLEKYVLIAVLCSHPQLYARPTMDQVVKMMETDESVPSIPERPIPLVAGRLDIERSVSSSGSGQLSSPTGYQSYTLESDHQSSNSREDRSSSSRILSTD